MNANHITNSVIAQTADLSAAQLAALADQLSLMSRRRALREIVDAVLAIAPDTTRVKLDRKYTPNESQTTWEVSIIDPYDSFDAMMDTTQQINALVDSSAVGLVVDDAVAAQEAAGLSVEHEGLNIIPGEDDGWEQPILSLAPSYND
jgi:hypothetical protein